MTDLNFLQQQQLLNQQHQIHQYNALQQKIHPNPLDPSIVTPTSQPASNTTNSSNDPSEQLQVDPNNQLNNNMGSNTQNFFNENISPFFAPYGIDVSHFPLTNPPIFESALYSVNDDSEPRSRRRISISNGQIGQIITTHTLDNDDLYDIQPPPYPLKAQQQAQHMHQLELQQQGLPHQPLQARIVNGLAPDQTGPTDLLPQQVQAIPATHGQQFQIPPYHRPAQAHQVISQGATTTTIKREPAPANFPQTDNHGIPNHKLVYNNEIIFNPDAGPIPGTAAWKKARLLERNRIAASKCRQRKKAAQIQLKEDIVKFERELDDLRKENNLLIDLYDLVKGKQDNGEKAFKADEFAGLLKKIEISLEKKEVLEKARLQEEEQDLDSDESDY